jgi:hypothetical protein
MKNCLAIAANRERELAGGFVLEAESLKKKSEFLTLRILAKRDGNDPTE